MDNETLWGTDDTLNIRSGPTPGVELVPVADGRYELIYGTAHGTDFAVVSMADLARLADVINQLVTGDVARILSESQAADQIRGDLGRVAGQVRSARESFLNGRDYYSALELYNEMADDLWARMQVRDDEPLPAVTWRMRGDRRSRHSAAQRILLTHSTGDLWFYGPRNGETFFGPATLDELRVMLADETWKP